MASIFFSKNNHKVITFNDPMQTHIVQIGNSLGLRLPKAVLLTLGLARDSRLSIQTKAGSFLLTPLQSLRNTWQAAFMADLAGQPGNLWGDVPLAESWDCWRLKNTRSKAKSGGSILTQPSANRATKNVLA